MGDGTAPTFLVPGVSKAGTTSIHHYIDEHDDIYMSNPKELHFFEREENDRRGLDYYEGQLDGWSGEPAVGETSPPYWNTGKAYNRDEYRWTPDDDAPGRIHEAYPDMRFVFSLRSPVSRAYSQYWKNVRQWRERAESFRVAVDTGLAGERDRTETPFCWIRASRYRTHLERWLELFDREQILFLASEESKNDVEGALNEIYHDCLKRTGIGEVVLSQPQAGLPSNLSGHRAVPVRGVRRGQHLRGRAARSRVSCAIAAGQRRRRAQSEHTAGRRSVAR